MSRIIAIVLVLLALAAPALAQLNCRSVILPEPAATQTAATGITHNIYFAPPPTPAEVWGHITYPIGYRNLYSRGLANVGLMFLSAQVFKVRGWEAGGWGYVTDGNGQFIANGDQLYVMGQSWALYPYRPGGIRFVWYHNLPVPDASTEAEQIRQFRTTIDADDNGINTALSTVMQQGEGVSLGVNVIARYREAIRVHVSLHLRECQ